MNKELFLDALSAIYNVSTVAEPEDADDIVATDAALLRAECLFGAQRNYHDIYTYKVILQEKYRNHEFLGNLYDKVRGYAIAQGIRWTNELWNNAMDQPELNRDNYLRHCIQMGYNGVWIGGMPGCFIENKEVKMEFTYEELDRVRKCLAWFLFGDTHDPEDELRDLPEKEALALMATGEKIASALGKNFPKRDGGKS